MREKESAAKEYQSQALNLMKDHESLKQELEETEGLKLMLRNKEREI